MLSAPHALGADGADGELEGCHPDTWPSAVVPEDLFGATEVAIGQCSDEILDLRHRASGSLMLSDTRSFSDIGTIYGEVTNNRVDDRKVEVGKEIYPFQRE